METKQNPAPADVRAVASNIIVALHRMERLDWYADEDIPEESRDSMIDTIAAELTTLTHAAHVQKTPENGHVSGTCPERVHEGAGMRALYSACKRALTAINNRYENQPDVWPGLREELASAIAEADALAAPLQEAEPSVLPSVLQGEPAGLHAEPSGLVDAKPAGEARELPERTEFLLGLWERIDDWHNAPAPATIEAQTLQDYIESALSDARAEVERLTVLYERAGLELGDARMYRETAERERDELRAECERACEDRDCYSTLCENLKFQLAETEAELDAANAKLARVGEALAIIRDDNKCECFDGWMCNHCVAVEALKVADLTPGSAEGCDGE